MTSVPPEKTRESHKEDGEVLASLLVEYSDKLSNLCDGIEVHRAKKRMRLFLSWSIALCATIVAFVYIAVFVPQFLSLYVSVIVASLIALPSLYLIFLPLGGGRSTLYFLWPVDLKEERFIREAKLLSNKLEKVIRIISQIQDHSPRNISSRIEMDFRLTEAELVLERSLLYVRQK
jgi:hypothetical protein